MNVFVCGPARSGDRRRILHCPVCERRRRHVVNFGGYWGITVHCCGCGDSWMDGELAPRPFARGWREKAIASAKRRYDAAPSGPAPGMCDQFGHDPDRLDMCDCEGDA